MFNLVRNELTKIFSKVSTYVILGLLVLGAFGWGALYRFLMNFDDTIYYEDHVSEYEFLLDERKYALRGYTEGTWGYAFCAQDIAVYELLIEYYEANPKGGNWADEAAWNWCDVTFGMTPAYISPDGYGTWDEIQEDWEDGRLQDDTEISITQELYDTAQARLAQLKTWLLEDDWRGFYTAMQAEPDMPEKRVEMYRSLLAENVNPADYNHWMVQVWEDYYYSYYEVQSYDEMLAEGMEVSQASYDKAKALRDISWYRIENKMEHCVLDSTDASTDYTFHSNAWSAYYGSAGLVSFLGILMAIIAGSIVASEFSEGTIKFLLINPTKRQRIFWSKWIAVMIFVVIGTLGLLLCSGLSMMIFFGTDGLSAQYIHLEEGKLIFTNAFSLVLQEYFRYFVEAVVLTIVAFSISSIFRNAGVAIGISIGVFTMGNTVTTVLAMLKQDWGRYLIFANMDPLGIAKGRSVFPHHSVELCWIVLAVHVVLFLWTARDAFVRREV